MTASSRATGHVETRNRGGGPTFYAKLKLPDGTQPRRRLGRVWSKRSQPPPGYLTKRQAEARLAAILSGDDPLVNVAPSHVTFGGACAEHLRYLEHERQRKRSTLSDYGNVIQHDLIPWFGESTAVESITTVQVEAFKDHLLGRGLSLRTAQKVLVLLHAILKRAARKGWIASNPCEAAEKLAVRRSDEFNVLSVEQVHAVARCAATSHLGHVIVVAAFTGLRLGELLALRWKHVNFTDRILHVERGYVAAARAEDSPKSHRRRSVPLSDQAMVALDALSRREHFTGPDDLVFGNVAGDYSAGDHIRAGFYTALEATGLGHLREPPNPIVFHDLRHTFGSLCAANGIDLPRIQRWMGHADVQTTMRYLHYLPAHDDAARLTSAFSGPSQHAPVATADTALSGF